MVCWFSLYLCLAWSLSSCLFEQKLCVSESIRYWSWLYIYVEDLIDCNKKPEHPFQIKEEKYAKAMRSHRMISQLPLDAIVAMRNLLINLPKVSSSAKSSYTQIMWYGDGGICQVHLRPISSLQNRASWCERTVREIEPSLDAGHKLTGILRMLCSAFPVVKPSSALSGLMSVSGWLIGVECMRRILQQKCSISCDEGFQGMWVDLITRRKTLAQIEIEISGHLT